jgi:predicted O-methyltransferase YrrM
MYDLSHLTNGDRVQLGPIHDAEALILYAWLRATNATRVLELGGLGGYSARNFLAAGCDVITAELNPLDAQSDRHTVLRIDCGQVADHVAGRFDLVFFDAHDYSAETHAFDTLRDKGCIDPDTLIVVHDTGWHAEQMLPHAERTEHGWLHCLPAHQLRDYLVSQGCREVYLPTFHGMSLLWI